MSARIRVWRLRHASRVLRAERQRRARERAADAAYAALAWQPHG